MTPRLSVIIPWANRPELARTLVLNEAEFKRAGAEVLIACCGGDRALLSHCLAEASETPVVVVEIETRFNKALALNLGVSRARADSLLLLDSDVVLDAGACAAALELVSPRCAVTLDRVVESSRSERTPYPHLCSVVHSTELEMADGRRIRIETNRRRVADGSRSAPGIVFLNRDSFIEVDGMNSDLSGWGWEDLDLLLRLQLLSGASVERAGGGTHLSHGDEQRCIDGASRASNEALNASMCLANYGLGHFYGTYEDDVAKWFETEATALESK
jgi:glycosyltransferase involved in cell wall biosynthesis